MRRVILLLCLTSVHGDYSVNNHSDIIITYEGHVEASNTTPERTTAHSVQQIPERTTSNGEIGEIITEMIEPTTEPAVAVAEYPADDDAVLFIPHEREVERIEDEFYKTPVRIADIMDKKNMEGVMMNAETGTPTRSTKPPENPDILFISGKNAEKEDIVPKRRQSEKHMDMPFRRSGSESSLIQNLVYHYIIPATRSRLLNKVLSLKKGIGHTHHAWQVGSVEKIIHKKLDCTNLNCNNNMKSICGGKKENGGYKYRLFLNECYFRKVNCAFSYAENRYKEVPKVRCNSVAIHLKSPPSPAPAIPLPRSVDLNKWKSFSSRRSMNMEADGRFCSHPCPGSCPEDYDPECAVSKSGIKKVFVNHCKLDYNSCFYGEVWQRRPLSDCVGGQRADMQHNRRFIGWMQRVGMVDKKGRLSL